MESEHVLEGTRPEERGKSEAAAAVLDLAAAYDAYAAPLYRFLLTLLSHTEEAEDALQEVFFGLLRRTGRGRIANLRAYLFQAAYHQAVMARRRKRAHSREQAAELATWIDVRACADHQRELALDVARALHALPARQRAVAALRLGEQMTFREIAEVLGITGNSAASLHRLALAKIRARLSEDDEHER